jgi:DNA-binding transcriptional MerR regulator
MFRIAAFARLGGVTPKVLRDYDALGLFRPAWVDAASGYRLYSPAQLPVLRRILALREMGASLAEIRSLVVDGVDLRQVLERRREALEQARRDVDRRLASLGITIAGAQAGSPDVVVRDLQAELVATFDVARTSGDDHRAFYELELAVRDAGVRAPRPPGELIWERHAADEALVEVFVPVRRPEASLATRRLPAVRAATILHHGSYASLTATRQTLDRWIAAAGLVATQPLRVLYLQFGAEDDLRLPRQYLVERAADLMTEIQVPLLPD